MPRPASENLIQIICGHSTVPSYRPALVQILQATLFAFTESTKSGRPDHSLLLSATKTLDRLCHQVEARVGVSVTVSEHGPRPTGDSVEAQLQLVEQELSPSPPIASNSERRDSLGSSQWGGSTMFVSSKFEQFMYSDPLPGIRGHQGIQLTPLSVGVLHQRHWRCQ